ncbi:MAG TPA: alanine racemase, partial [Anaerolineae bacterium]|nr:alanine racemase [Anaerolineae bacterium]HIQ05731.1 alanine racemase [Anaerolineae bacterium]
EIPTPALVVDLDKLHRNIDEMAERARKAGIKLRPHIKTHKTPIIAHMQMKAGAVGITCAKLGEAEVMAAAGIEDIFIAYPIVGQDKIERLLNLARWVPKISTSVDTFEAARVLNEAAVARGRCIDVLVEVEAGYRRTGIEPGEPMLRFVKEIVTSMPGLRYKGLMYMAGDTCKYVEREKQLAGEQAGAKVATDAAALLRAHGIETEVISGGSTPGAQYMHLLEGVTEYRAGCYVFGDMKYADLGALTRDQMSLTILTTVVSVPSISEPDHFVVDAGSKTLTHSDATTTPGYGTFVQYPNLAVNVASEEHGAVHLPKGMRPPAIGTKLDIYPNYVSDVVNLSDKLWVVQGDDVIATWDILARGKRV